MRYPKIACAFLLAAAPMLGEAKLEIRQGRPVVDGVYVNGHGPYRFLVDTGAQGNQLEVKLARSIGLQPTFQVDIVTAAGVIRVSGREGIEVRLDTVEATGQEFLFTDLQAVRQLSADIQGVLGQSFLSRSDYLLDFLGKRLSFGMQDRKGTRAEFKLLDGRPSVFSNLGWLVLDSGADHVILFGEGSSKRTQTIRTASGLLDIAIIRTTQLIIEGRTIAYGDAVEVPRQSSLVEDGLLPARLFHAVYVCNSGGYLILD